jgi:hypothetical protein
MSRSVDSVPVGRFTTVAVAASLLGAAGATAAGEPSVFAASRIGTLDVVSGVLVSPTSVDLRGVWVDENRPCSETRLLDVKGVVDYVPFGRQGRRFQRRRTFRTANCAEGGPNMGFTLSAKSIGFGCPNGRWKPGQYTFVTTSVDHRKRLRAVASVGWENRRAC